MNKDKVFILKLFDIFKMICIAVYGRPSLSDLRSGKTIIGFKQDGTLVIRKKAIDVLIKDMENFGVSIDVNKIMNDLCEYKSNYIVLVEK
jgi:hypothetical protein